MLNKCKARSCNTYIGDSQDFCRKHWETLPFLLQKQLRRTTEALQRGENGAREALNGAIAEAVDTIANKEREASLKKQVTTALSGVINEAVDIIANKEREVLKKQVTTIAAVLCLLLFNACARPERSHPAAFDRKHSVELLFNPEPGASIILWRWAPPLEFALPEPRPTEFIIAQSEDPLRPDVWAQYPDGWRRWGYELFGYYTERLLIGELMREMKHRS